MLLSGGRRHTPRQGSFQRAVGARDFFGVWFLVVGGGGGCIWEVVARGVGVGCEEWEVRRGTAEHRVRVF
jgi:hypothetical protein